MRSSRSDSPATTIWISAAAVLVVGCLAMVWLLSSDETPTPELDDDSALTSLADQPPVAPTFENTAPPDRPAQPIAVQSRIPRVTHGNSIGQARIGGPEGGIYGRTVDPAGDPIEGVIISLYLGHVLFPGSFPGTQQAIDVSAVSDAGGRFVLEGIPVDKAYVVVGEHDDYAKGEFSNVEVRQGENTGEIELRLTQGAQICGTVQSASSGTPLGGARVELYYTLSMVWQKPEDQKPWKVVFANGSGHFCFTHVSESSIKVRVSADGYEILTISKSYALEAKPRDENLLFELRPGQSLPGRVLSDTGEGVPHARIEATAQVGEFTSNAVAYSDEGGHFLLEGMGTGPYQVRATCVGYSTATMQRATTSAGHIQLTMTRRGGVEGWVYSTGNQPVTQFSLHLLRNHPTAGPNYLNKNRSFFDTEGWFLFDDLEPGTYELEARAEGYADARSDTFSILKGSVVPAQVRIVMSRGGTLTGVITNPSGEVVRGALVTLNSNNHVESQISRIFRQLAPSDERMRKQRTGSDGTYRFENIPSGVYQVAVEHTEYAPRSINDVSVIDDDLGGTAPLNIQLPPGAIIAGRAFGLDGELLSFCKVQISQSGTGYMDATTTNEDGHFSFSNLREGNYQVTLIPKRVNGAVVHPFLVLVYAKNSMVEIFVSEGQSRRELSIQMRDQ